MCSRERPCRVRACVRLPSRDAGEDVHVVVHMMACGAVSGRTPGGGPCTPCLEGKCQEEAHVTARETAGACNAKYAALAQLAQQLGTAADTHRAALNAALDLEVTCEEGGLHIWCRAQRVRLRSLVPRWLRVDEYPSVKDAAAWDAQVAVHVARSTGDPLVEEVARRLTTPTTPPVGLTDWEVVVLLRALAAHAGEPWLGQLETVTHVSSAVVQAARQAVDAGNMALRSMHERIWDQLWCDLPYVVGDAGDRSLGALVRYLDKACAEGWLRPCTELATAFRALVARV